MQEFTALIITTTKIYKFIEFDTCGKSRFLANFPENQIQTDLSNEMLKRK